MGGARKVREFVKLDFPTSGREVAEKHTVGKGLLREFEEMLNSSGRVVEGLGESDSAVEGASCVKSDGP
jgi:hypothetical protein